MPLSWDTEIKLTTFNSVAVLVDSPNQRGYVVGTLTSHKGSAVVITRVNLATFAVIDTLTCTKVNPGPAVIDAPRGFIYIGHLTGGWVTKVDLSTFTEAAFIQLAVGSFSCASLAFDSVANLLYAVNDETAPAVLRLYKVDPTGSMSIVNSMTLSATHTQVQGGAYCDPTLGYVWIGDDQGTIYRVDTATFTVGATVSIPASNVPEAVTYDGKNPFFADCSDFPPYNVWKLDPATLATVASATFNLTGSFPGSTTPSGQQGIAADPTRCAIYALVGSDISGDPETVQLLKASDLTQVAAVSTGAQICNFIAETLYLALGLDPANLKGYAAGGDANGNNGGKDWLGRFTMDSTSYCSSPPPVTITGAMPWRPRKGHFDEIWAARKRRNKAIDIAIGMGLYAD